MMMSASGVLCLFNFFPRTSYELVLYFAPQTAHYKRFLIPLIGSTGMIRNNVMNRVPCFFMNLPSVPQLPQRIRLGAVSERHEKKCVPMMKKKNAII